MIFEKISNLFDKKEETKQKPTQQEIWLDQLNQMVSNYTPIVDTPEVQIALDRIAELIGSMTIHLKKNTEKGDERVVNGLSRKIDIEPNSKMTRSILIQGIVKNMLIYGNAIVVPTYTKEGYIDELKPLDMRGITFVENETGYRIKTIDGIEINNDEFLHFRLNPDLNRPYVGRGYKVYLKDVTDQLNTSRSTITDFMNNRMIPSVVIRVDALTDEFKEEAGKESIYNQYVKRTSAGQPWIIPADLIDIQTIAPLSLKDIAIDDTVKLGKETVANIFGMPAFLLGIGEFEEKAYNHFIRTRIMSIGKIISEELTKKLLFDPDLYFKLNPRSLYAYDTMELANVGADMFTKGIMTGNEVRDWLDLSHKDGLDELIILENYINLDDIDKQGKLKGGDQ